MIEDTEKDNADQAIDPPDHQGGGGMAEESTDDESTAVDPPDHQGGGGS